MLNPMRTWNAWFALSSQAARLGLEAQTVIALRLMRLAAGGARAQSEKVRMSTEKIQALVEAQAAVATTAIKGGGGRQVAKKVLSVYKRRVRRNRRRLTK